MCRLCMMLPEEERSQWEHCPVCLKMDHNCNCEAGQDRRAIASLKRMGLINEKGQFDVRTIHRGVYLDGN